MIQISIDWFKNAFSNAWHVFSGLLTMAVGYFIPVKDFVHLVLFFFLLDIIFGYCAAKKLRKEQFSPKIIWEKTVPRAVISIVAILTSYMWDTTFHQEIIPTYKWIGWFISGLLLYSIFKNGYKITKWKVFPMMGHIIETKIEEASGMELHMEDEFNEYLPDHEKK